MIADPKTHFAGAKDLKLHLGGWQVKEGWTIVNVDDRPEVDVRSNIVDLSMFPDGSAAEVYASHVYEHLGYQKELQEAIREARRVLKQGGILRVAVPDLEALAFLFDRTRNDLQAQTHVMRMIMGGQMDEYDFHKTGFSFNILCNFLHGFGFIDFRRVKSFGLFDDTSEGMFLGVPISLNVECARGA